MTSEIDDYWLTETSEKKRKKKNGEKYNKPTNKANLINQKKTTESLCFNVCVSVCCNNILHRIDTLRFIHDDNVDDVGGDVVP